MKYQWSINVMTRHSGCLTIYCKDRQQAEDNVVKYIDYVNTKVNNISFSSLSQLANSIVMSEIIAVTCCDLEMMYDVHREDVKLHKECVEQSDYPPPIDFSQEEDKGY